ncbi:nucleotidyltransferase [bacterium]|nr:nucleotidyltransferase [bacterium]
MNIDWKNVTIQELSVIIATHLQTHGIDAVLVGGACVTIYSRNNYVSKDLDFIAYEPYRDIQAALSQLGFKSHQTRHFTHPQCPYYIDFLPPPIAIGEQPIERFKLLKTKRGHLKLLTPTDCVKDRLAAFFHWDDFQSLNQALLVSKNHNVSQKAILEWAAKEGCKDKYLVYLKRLKTSL